MHAPSEAVGRACRSTTSHAPQPRDSRLTVGRPDHVIRYRVEFRPRSSAERRGQDTAQLARALSKLHAATVSLWLVLLRLVLLLALVA